MILLVLAWIALVLAAIPALLFLANCRLYLPAPRIPAESVSVSVLIPARNEEKSIGSCVAAALASRGVIVEVIVLDDHSEDATAAIVRAFAENDARVHLVRGEPLPAGWCGKQHACQQLARLARYDLLAFVDADVRLAPDGLARLAAFQKQSGADLVSGLARQAAVTWLEKLLIPLIHFILLGFLPLRRMRRSTHPSYAAGCGQLFLADRVAYEAVGGHARIRATLHDGILLPRAFRQTGRRTDLCDATDLATCRMYRGAGQVWHGLAKNATEGLAAPTLIVPVTALLLGGQVLPVLLLIPGVWLSPAIVPLALAATLLAYLPRFLGVIRFRQSLLGALLHPLGVLLLLTIQWYALGRKVLGRPATWKGRAYGERVVRATGLSG